VIVGSLDDIARYQGELAGLSDFYYPRRFGSGVMLWRAEAATDIYTKWVEAGQPQVHRFGDGGWIWDVRPNADRLQDLFPGQFVSFKAHCLGGVPANARAVCFHGNPRPHVL